MEGEFAGPVPDSLLMIGLLLNQQTVFEKPLWVTHCDRHLSSSVTVCVVSAGLLFNVSFTYLIYLGAFPTIL